MRRLGKNLGANRVMTGWSTRPFFAGGAAEARRTGSQGRASLGAGTARRPCPAGRAQRRGRAGSAEASGDVGLGGLLLGVAEDLAGGVHLDEPTGFAGAGEVEEGGVLGDTRGLLHVVGDDHDRVLAAQLVDEVLDRGGGDRVERRAG